MPNFSQFTLFNPGFGLMLQKYMLQNAKGNIRLTLIFSRVYGHGAASNSFTKLISIIKTKWTVITGKSFLLDYQEEEIDVLILVHCTKKESHVFH